MRQAGRYLPEYRALRERHPFLECVRAPELAAELTLQPMQRFPLDAAIVFSDILIVLEAMGLSVEFPPGGPRVTPRLADASAAGLRRPDAARDLGYVADALRLVREKLGPDRALLGFAGAPFTLACYAIEGGGSRDFAAVRSLLHAQPRRFGELLARLADAVGDLLVLQVEAGADAVQLFDTWAGALSREDYAAHVAPHARAIVRRVHDAGGRIILMVKDGGHVVEEMIASGADCIGLDWRVDLAATARTAAGRCSIQGNLDPAVLFAPDAVIRARVDAIHADVGGRTGHVLNLGHGILPGTPIEGVEAFLAAVASLGGNGT